MKTNWVATLYAGKFQMLYRCQQNWRILLITGLWIFISCSNSDDFVAPVNAIDEDPPIQNEPPADDDAPVVNDDPVDDGSTVYEESVIIYTDIEPDFSSTNLADGYDIDLNQDGTVDFSIQYNNEGGYEWLGIGAYQTDDGILSVSPWYTNTVPVDEGYKIFVGGFRNGESYANGSLFTIGDCFGGDPDCSINWELKGDKYLAVRMLIDRKMHYGWIRMEITSASEWIVKDFAFNATPKTPILAGQQE
ncbi:hypothetical protein C8P64_3284 [Christiangramia gaetbulicola]|uniref:Uncharacterized protein n=1 Tax=Christiangramia gaetbulicola TaxID=703340 RepID=A0A2T6ACE3_9FLAO|nr:hypothetical protein [Christiangramia gaetbulicola]PTX41484.1 hypothetical protein C8P64_3284 [Christiangramia gaetbulicola]